EKPQAVEVMPSPEQTKERVESIDPPLSPSTSKEQSQAQEEANAPANESAGVVNPFIASPGGDSSQAENADQMGEEQKPPSEAEQSETTTRDLLKEVPDSYPIENAEAYYVPPEERYPGNLGGPPPLKLPPINAPESAGEGAEPSGELAPPAPF
ncbi:MAG: hypothetical protein KAG66_05710, partial [Methylococcales bacterium]|nr:hypothetical protein [Methylococcales bacterium]